jgi:hypothetical protein
VLTLEQRDEVVRTIEAIRGTLEDLVVRGVATAGPDGAKRLQALRDQLARRDAPHLASRLDALATAIGTRDRAAAAALLRAQISLRVFERVLTLDVAEGLLAAIAGDDDPEPRLVAGEETEHEPTPASLPAIAELARAVEDLVTTGLTAASAATRQRIEASSTEAARLKLGRLAPALRYANEEVARFLAESPSFSAQRLAFFLVRAWILLRGIERATAAKDRKALGRLLWQGAPPVPVASVRAVTLGVSKRVVQDVTSAFDFRLRVLEDAGPLRAGDVLVWSFLRQMVKDFSADALLHVEQAQGFRPRVLLDGSEVAFTQVAVARDGRGPARLVLGPPSKVAVGRPWKDWTRWVGFDAAAALARVRAHRPGPLDLEVELEEEVVLDDWTLDAPRDGFRPDVVVYPLGYRGVVLDAVASKQDEGKALRAALDALRKKKTRPPLVALIHYEAGRIVARPLSVLDPDGPRHLAISSEKVDLAELTRAIMRP